MEDYSTDSLYLTLNRFYNNCNFRPQQSNNYKECYDYLMNFPFAETHLIVMYNNVLPHFVNRFKFSNKFNKKNHVCYSDLNRQVPTDLLDILCDMNIQNKKEVVVVSMLMLIHKQNLKGIVTNYMDELELCLGVDISQLSVNDFLQKYQSRPLCDLSETGISILPNFSTLFTTITELDIRFNKLTNIDILVNMTQLKKLFCSRNRLNSIPIIPSLTFLDCYGNPDIKRIGYYENLLELHCQYCSIEEIVSMPKLLFMTCCKNNLTRLNSFRSLRELTCMGNPIKELSFMPFLQKLKIMCTQITHLPELKSLTYLEGSECLITTGFLHNEMTEIYCPSLFDTIGDHNLYESSMDRCILRNRCNQIVRFRELYYSLKYKSQLRNFLWERVRRPKLEMYYHPERLLAFLEENEEDWQDKIESW